jgi:hypothetical protein
LDIENPEGMTHIAAGGLWSVDDVVFLQEPLTGGFWGKITAKTNMTTYWRLTVQNATPIGTGVFPSDTIFLHFSEAGGGKPIGEIYSTFYAPAPGNTGSLDVKDPVGLSHADAGALWVVNDTALIQSSTAGEFWGRVTAKTDMSTYWRITVLNIAPAINPGAPVAHYSSTGDAKLTGKTLTVFPVPTVGNTGPLNIEDPAGMSHADAGNLWVVNDQVRLSKPLSVDVIGTVTAKTDMTTYWRVTVQNISSSVSGTFPAGAAVLNYGQNGQGLVRITADANDNPYISIATHNGSPWGGMTERVRLGNLAGISGASGYGLWTNNGYFTGTVNANAGNIAGWTITSGHLYAGYGSYQAGLQPASYPFYAGSDTPGSAPFRVTQNGVLTATSGTVGGWTLAETKLYWENPASYQGIGMATYNDASGFAFWAGDHRPDYAEFRVSNNGAMWASSGNIAGWTIASGHLYSGTGSNRTGLQPASYPFYAGSETPAAAPFSVTQAGALTATNVNIVSGGGNVTLDSNGLRLAYAATSTAYVSWYSSSTLKAYIGSYVDGTTNLLRVNVQSSGRFEVTGAAEVNLSGTTQVANLRTNGGLGFFTTSGSGASKQTVTGSRGGNAALASLLTALSAYGLITDSTTA